MRVCSRKRERSYQTTTPGCILLAASLFTKAFPTISSVSGSGTSTFTTFTWTECSSSWARGLPGSTTDDDSSEMDCALCPEDESKNDSPSLVVKAAFVWSAELVDAAFVLELKKPPRREKGAEVDDGGGGGGGGGC